MENNISKEKLLVNSLTFLRIPLTVMGILSIYQYGRTADCHWVTHFFTISLCVFFTDYMDGLLARHWDVCSEFGAKLDLFCDSFYIFSSLVTMILIKVGSPWILLIAFYKLLEFMLTSSIKRKSTKRKTFYSYDKIGRILSALFYLTPVLLLVHHTEASPLCWRDSLVLYTLILMGLTIISTLARLRKLRKHSVI